jgi:hypothetical protein
LLRSARSPPGSCSASPRIAIALFAAVTLVLAVWGTLSPSIRTAPSLDDLLA